MKVSILPADTYTVINKTILTDIDRKVLVNLYEPIVGGVTISLYLTLWSDLEKSEVMSQTFTHHHLMSKLKYDLNMIKIARESLEAMGLLKTYVKEGNINDYVYELYAPMSAQEFFNHPILNVVLYNNIGKKEYEDLVTFYEKVKYDLTDYVDITKEMNDTYKSISGEYISNPHIKKNEIIGINIAELIDFDFVISSLPKNMINDKTFNKKTKELINALAFIYDLENLKMVELLRKVINEHGLIDKESLRKEARKYYVYANNGTLPTLIYRTQPDYLKSPTGDTSNRGKILYVFENTTPYDFLKSKYHGATPTARDLKLLEYLAMDLELKPAVINVLIDYVLKSNNNKLVTAFIETIAGQWKRLNVETASQAMDLAEKEHKKYVKKSPKTTTEQKPVWFDETLDKESISEEERQELDNLLKEFR